jgi:ATP-dependent DNA helicase DinG
MRSAEQVLGPEGPFSRRLEGFTPRREQIEMAAAVERAIRERGTLVCEAGTGTGKTFAYLVPALLCGGKVIVSTGTKNLQDQLFRRDLPLVREALGVAVKTALLKGRSNYLCLHRLELHRDGGRWRNPRVLAALERVVDWSGRTREGDIAECGVEEDSPLWPAVTSSVDNCLGSECTRAAECYLLRARRRAQEAELVVVNHHLLFADLTLKEEGVAELLPGADAFIIDEAHQLPEVASSFFGLSLSTRQLLELAKDTGDEQVKEAPDQPELRAAAEVLEKAARDLRLAFGEPARRAAWSEVAQSKEVLEAVAELDKSLAALVKPLEVAKGRGKGLESCFRRCVELRERCDRLTGTPPEGYIHWFETYPRSVAVHLTPLDVAEAFQGCIGEQRSAWVFTSATLAVGASFSHFGQRLGIRDAVERRWESPFDFRRQAVLYVPEGLPEPRAPGYTAALIDQAIPVLEASGGRAFLLFTSHRALREAAQLLEQRVPYPLLVQGSASRAALLERFRELGNAVLLGTSSFWEGVDVRGEALSLVIIDKLPFASPGDPVVQARIDALKEQGLYPFTEFQLPHAVITLKQGVGRLIRDIRDRGVMMLCDPRLLTKSYGRVFLDSLPPMTRTRKLEVVQRFFALEKLAQAEAAGDAR